MNISAVNSGYRTLIFTIRYVQPPGEGKIQGTAVLA